ncbi:hypothetical protein ES707_13301 [subsurface metagenome]
MPEKKVQCPHCNEIFKLDLPAVSAEQLTRVDIEEILRKVQSPGAPGQIFLDHRHKTADEFLDCPECRLWVDNTAQRYQVIEKEPPPGEKPGDQPGEGEEKPALGSIFKEGGEHG